MIVIHQHSIMLSCTKKNVKQLSDIFLNIFYSLRKKKNVEVFISSFEYR